MISYLTDIIRTSIVDHVKRGKAADVYQLASELHSQYPSSSEEELALLITKITLEIQGAAVLWERHGDSYQA
jgi:hypothetical protein